LVESHEHFDYDGEAFFESVDDQDAFLKSVEDQDAFHQETK